MNKYVENLKRYDEMPAGWTKECCSGCFVPPTGYIFIWNRKSLLGKNDSHFQRALLKV